MGRLSKEVEETIDKYYKAKNGQLVTVAEWGDAVNASQSVGNYCDSCGTCLADAPVISAGEIDPNLRGQGLFSVGPTGIKDKTKCPIVSNFK